MFSLDIAGAVARIHLDRPAVRNAVAIGDWLQLPRLLEEAEAQGATVAVIAGRGGAFCAGADLADFGAFASDTAARSDFRIAMRAALDALAASNLATIAFVEGACFGAGVALAMACDVRVAAPSVRLGITPARLGIAYPQEDVARLVGLVGPGQAARLLLGAAAIDGAEALRIGLVDMLGGAEEVEAIIAGIAANDPGSLKVLKRGLRLAARGVASDSEQDRLFDELLGGAALTERLVRLRS